MSSEDTLTPPPPPPPVVPPDVIPERAPAPKESKPKRVPMARPGLARKGNSIQLLTNHYKVAVGNVDGHFFHYNVVLKYEDDRSVEAKGVGRKVIDKLKLTYDAELGGKDFAYDGEHSLFTIGALPLVNNIFTVVLDDMSSNKSTGNVNSKGGNPGSPSDENDRKRIRRNSQSKTFNVELNFATKIPMQSIKAALQGHDSENSQEAFRVLDIVLRQHSSRQGCLLVRQSFFHNDIKNMADLGGGVMGCRGFHSSFRTAQNGLSLNIDVSTTMVVRPGPVIDFLLANQNARNPSELDWAKAKRALKNLRIKTRPNYMEYKIVGLSEMPCNKQMFMLKQKNDDGSFGEIEITVYDYFVNRRNVQLSYSESLPCLNVGKPKRPTYIPIELCELIPLQRYTKALTVFQRSSLVEKSRQKPQERIRVLNDALKNSNYDSDPILRSCGISINSQFTQVDGRVLPAPKLKLGNGDEMFPRNGRWNMNNKKMFEPVKVERWAVVNFSARCDTRRLVQDLIRCGNMKGILIDDPFDVFDESPATRRAPANIRVDNMFDLIKSKLPGIPKFLLCLLPDRKNCEIYGPWKKKNLTDIGIVTQCMCPIKVNDMYLSNLLLKINSKLGGINSLLCIENSPSLPVVSKVPTLILGMDVSHGAPGHSDAPSIAAVVSSRQWPRISRYRATVRSQSPRVEMIDGLFKPNADGSDDDGIMRELLKDFYSSSGKRKPEQIIVFRDGVSESQFNQVLNVELDQMIEACKLLDENWTPRFTVIVAQKNHHTKFFQTGGCPDNVPPGTIIDNRVCHPRNFDFYMCAHAGMIGTTRPTHYHVLYDENNFSADDMQELVHSLSYVYQRSTTAISIVAPVAYAHLAAAQVGTFTKFEDSSESSSSHDGITSAGSVSVTPLLVLHEKVCSSMFFC